MWLKNDKERKKYSENSKKPIISEPIDKRQGKKEIVASAPARNFFISSNWLTLKLNLFISFSFLNIYKKNLISIR